MIRIGLAVGFLFVLALVFPPHFWFELARPNRDWKAGLPVVPVDPTAQADMDRARVAGEEHARRQLANSKTEPVKRTTTEAEEGR